MTEFNPNCGKCGMLNSRGFCALTACRYPSNVIVTAPKVIRSMMVNPQIEKPMTHFDEIKDMSVEELADFLGGIFTIETDIWGDYDPRLVVTQEPRVEIRDKESMMEWLKSPVEVEE